ncbi:MAG: hypothetical protein JJE27_04625 [Thermoleophilia bacterium]|nr:hypothetical protein [Thermoleophilia bacterium]
MSILAWAMMGIAIWHYAVFVPDRFLGGIVGAFFAALIGAVAVAFVLNGFDAPGKDQTHLIQAFLAIPGSLVGLGFCYWLGIRREENPEA